ncbi:MAG: helix-turn-helix domain-containing protein [Pseudomonadales bacterium]|nr:helix-turn-helix domain-containing protein [Pseudomonadales bacterium]
MNTLPERQQYIEWINEVTTDRRPTIFRPEPKNKLTEWERKKILAICNETNFSHFPPSQIVPILADEGIYLASESSFYRVLTKANQLKHRGRHKKKGTYTEPTSYTEMQANEVWSWARIPVKLNTDSDGR